MSGPLVSILVRSVGRDTLKQALASVAAQDYQHIEVWVVAATPRHPPLAAAGAPFPVELVPTEHPLPRAKAANRALECARGQLALFLDDDDWIAPSHVSALVRALMQPAHARAGAKAPLVAYTRTQTTDAEGKTDGQPVIGGPFDAIQLLAGNTLALHSALFSLELRSLGCRFDESLDLYEDWDFWLQAAQHGPFSYVDQATAFYRIHDSSGVHRELPFRGAAARKIYDKWRTRWPEAALPDLMQRVWEHTQLEIANRDARARVQQLQRDIAMAQQQLAARQAQLRSLTESRSWRITAPLRQVTELATRWLALLERAARQPHRIPAELAQLVRAGLRNGPGAMQQALGERLHRAVAYPQWIAANEPEASAWPQLAKQAETWVHQPLISVLMPTYNSPLQHLREAIDSVRAQVYPHWELCIADDASPREEVRAFLREQATQDPRIVLTLRNANGHISAASNTALASAKGEWIALLDHDDLLHPLALWCVVQTLQQHPDAQVIFSDEDKLDDAGKRFGPYFKGAYNRELMWAQNMVSHLGCYRRSTVMQAGGFREGYEGSQDYDLALRVIERCTAAQVVHIPRVLYHWRAIEGSTARAPGEKPYAETASRRALADHLRRIGIAATVEAATEVPNMNRVRPALPQPVPRVSMVVQSHGDDGALDRCVASLHGTAVGMNNEVLVLGSAAAPMTMQQALAAARGDFICLIDDHVQAVAPGWLDELLSFAALPGIGAVAPRLWHADGSGLAHAGLVLGLGGLAGVPHAGAPRGQPGYFGRTSLHHRCSALSAVCLLLRRETLLAVDSVDSELDTDLRGVDLCLKLRRMGLSSVFVPHVDLLWHAPAVSADVDARRQRQLQTLRSRWGEALQADPMYSPNLSLDHTDLRFAVQSRVPALA